MIKRQDMIGCERRSTWNCAKTNVTIRANDLETTQNPFSKMGSMEFFETLIYRQIFILTLLKKKNEVFR